MRKAIVIGAGIAGLASGIRLQKAGYQVDIFEKNHFPGGKVYRLEKDGFHFDVGPAWLSMPTFTKALFDLAGENIEDYLSLAPLDPMFVVHQNNCPEKSHPVSSSYRGLTELIENIDPTQMKSFTAYLGAAHLRYTRSKKALIQKPFNRKRDFFNFSTLCQAIRIRPFTTSREYLKKYIKNPTLIDLFSFYSLFENADSYNGPNYFFFMPMLALSYGLWHVKGGMAAFAKALEQLFTKLGGRIHYQCNVDKILIENQKAYGVQIGDQLALSDCVVCNVDFPHGMKHLVKNEAAKGPYSDEFIHSLSYSPSGLVMCFGTNRSYPLTSAHHFFMSKDVDENISQISQGMMLEDPSFYLNIPSKQDSDLAPEGKDGLKIFIPLSNLSVAKYGWEEGSITYYKNKVFKILSKVPGFENLKNEIISESIFTPLDFQSAFNAYNGSCFGLSSGLSQSLYNAPQSAQKHCQGLFFVGSSVHPGGSIPFALEGAEIAVKEILMPR